jgi:hypothetical protein
VIAGGVGAMMDVSDRLFVNIGMGYQIGFQSASPSGEKWGLQTRFLRIALGIGMKL